MQSRLWIFMWAFRKSPEHRRTYVSRGVQGTECKRKTPSRRKCCWGTAGRTRNLAWSWTNRVGKESTQKCRRLLHTFMRLMISMRTVNWTSAWVNVWRSHPRFGCSWAARVWPSSLPPVSRLFSSTGCLCRTSGSPGRRREAEVHRGFRTSFQQRRSQVLTVCVSQSPLLVTLIHFWSSAWAISWHCSFWT